MDIRVVLKRGAAAVAAAALVLPLASAGAAPGHLEGLTRVSQDKIVDGLGLHRSVLQPALAADGKKTLVGVFEVGRIFNGGSSAVGWAVSSDGGRGWRDGLLPLTLAGKQKTTALGALWRAADASVAYDARHKLWLAAATGLDSTGGTVGLFVNSSNNGEKWSDPIAAHAADTGDAPQNGSLACDNSPASQGYGNCYLAYNNAASTPANRLQLITSTDGGATWSAPAATADTAVGTGTVALVQPPPSGAPAGTECGRLVVALSGGTGSNAGVFSFSSSDCGASLSARTQVLPNSTLTHTVNQTLRTGLVVSASMDQAGAIYLAWQTRSFRLQQTTLAAAANPGETNVKVGSVAGMVAGNMLTIDAAGDDPETVTMTAVGTSGAGGTGITFTPALGFAHASGAFVTLKGVTSTSTAAPNDIALSVMPAPTDATPAPDFGAPARIPIEADAGASSNTVDHFIPAIAANPAGASGELALFYYFYRLSNCQYVNNPTNSCSPQAGYVSSTDGGATWSASQALSPGPPSLAVLPRTQALGAGGQGGPDLGSVLAAAIVATGKHGAGEATGLFPVGIPVNGTDASLYAPKKGLTIGGGS